MDGSGDSSIAVVKKDSTDENSGLIGVESDDTETMKVKSLSLSDDKITDNDIAETKAVDEMSTVDTPIPKEEPTKSSDYSGRRSLTPNIRRRCYRVRSSGGSSDEDQSDDASGSRKDNSDTKASPSQETHLPRRKLSKHDGQVDDLKVKKRRGSSNTSHENEEHEPNQRDHLSSDISDDDDDDDMLNENENGDEEDLVNLDESSSDSSCNIFFEDVSSSTTENSMERPEEAEDERTKLNSADKTKKTETNTKKKEVKEIPRALTKPKPKETWNCPRALLDRELGFGPRAGRRLCQSAELFRAGFYGSLHSAERLELMYKLEGHQGCVNCLNFNCSGTKLASGSDDLEIKIWNPCTGKIMTSFHSGHRANVFQAKFMPFVGVDTMIVSCARDNQVRLNELSSSGEVHSSRKLAQHRGPAHKLAISPENPHVVLSCGEDSFVFSIDTRESKPNRLLNVREGGKKIALYSIHQNPFFPEEFCVSGKDPYVRIYDIRKLPSASVSVPVDRTLSSSSRSEDNSTAESRRAPPLKKFCPHHLVNATGENTSGSTANVTAAVYNYNGKEILATYNDDHIYLFDATHSDGADFIKKYEGHRNSATVKGVNFFGERSQFIVSGSDCGNIFVWEKNTECIVNFFRGDENGVINCLEGHPTVPILATSGLDDDIKIWIPSKETPPKMEDLKKTVKANYKRRESDSRDNIDQEGFFMWALLQHMRVGRRGGRRTRRRGTGGDDTDSSDNLESDDDVDEDDSQQGMDCAIA